MAILTLYNTKGEVHTVKPVTLHLVGTKKDKAIEIQVGQNSTVEVTLQEIFNAILEAQQ
jgi:hypothetical protein